MLHGILDRLAYSPPRNIGSVLDREQFTNRLARELAVKLTDRDVESAICHDIASREVQHDGLIFGKLRADEIANNRSLIAPKQVLAGDRRGRYSYDALHGFTAFRIISPNFTLSACVGLNDGKICERLCVQMKRKTCTMQRSPHKIRRKT